MQTQKKVQKTKTRRPGGMYCQTPRSNCQPASCRHRSKFPTLQRLAVLGRPMLISQLMQLRLVTNQRRKQGILRDSLQQRQLEKLSGGINFYVPSKGLVLACRMFALAKCNLMLTSLVHCHRCARDHRRNSKNHNFVLCGL